MEPNKLTATLRAMLPTLLAEVAMSALMLGVYALLGRLDARVACGAALGTAAALGNLLAMILLVLRAERAETPQKGQLYVRGTYPVRMLVLFGVLILALKSGYFDPLAAVLPLLFMRLALFLPQRGDKKEVQS